MGRLSTYMITSANSDNTADDSFNAFQLGVDRVQIRLPNSPTRVVERVVSELLSRVPDVAKRLFVNDRVDIAIALGLGGVQLPSRSFETADVRRSTGHKLRIGVSTHSLEDIRQAERGGADFVVFGPVYETASKPGHPGFGIGALREAVHTTAIPVYAVGGITLTRIREVAATGVSGVAGISAFAEVESLKRLMQATQC